MYRAPSNLLSIDTNAKTVKGQKLGFMTGILYLAPATLSGRNTCAMADIAQCAAACLNTAGRGRFTAIQSARINKTNYFFENREAFMLHIAVDIAKLVKKANKAGLTPLVRLNGTSDIKWENIPVSIGANKHGIAPGQYANIMQVFPDVQFYDYTKLANRRDIPSNYDLTFSYSGVLAYQRFAQQARDSGMRIAVVFRHRENIPAQFLGLECIGGDDSDVRHLDPQGVVVALYAKGPAVKDQTGFVIDSPRRVIPMVAA